MVNEPSVFEPLKFYCIYNQKIGRLDPNSGILVLVPVTDLKKLLSFAVSMYSREAPWLNDQGCSVMLLKVADSKPV